MAVSVGVLGVTIAAMLYMAQNCGQQQVSSVQSLDNFAAGSQVFLNQCSAPVANRTRKTVAAAMAKVVVLAPENKHPMTVATHDALTAVPDQLLIWAMRHQGTVLVSRDTAELCTAALAQPENGGAPRSFPPGSLSACFVYFPATAKTREILNFNVANDAREIQHGLLKTFGSAVAQLAPEVEPGIYPALLAFEKNLARAFVADLVASNQKAFDIAALAPFLGRFDRAAVAAAAAAGQDPLDLFSYDQAQATKQYPGYAFNKKRFLDFVFAEAFDSYYCNNWGEFNEGKAQAIAAGNQPLADAKDLANTRRRMATFFPKSHGVFAAGIDTILGSLSNPDRLAGAGKQGFGLLGGGRGAPPSRTVKYENPYWAGTQAFFGSIWSNTGGAAANAYGRYTERVTQSVDNYYNSGGTNIAGAVAQGVGGGVVSTYEEEVAAPIREQTQQRFDVQMQGGASINEAAVNSVLLAVGDQTGATPFLEGTYGVDTTEARMLSGTERVVRVGQGGLQLLDTATGVGGLVSSTRAGSRLASAAGREAAAAERAAASSFDVGDAFNTQRAGAGLWEAADSATAGPQALRATREAYQTAAEQGLAANADEFLDYRYSNGQSRLESYAAGMSEDAASTTLRKGDRFYVVTDATQGTDLDRLAWGADKPPHPDVLGSRAAYDDFVNEAALPPLKGNAARTNARVLELEVTADGIPGVTSTVAPNYGGQGGISQTLLTYNKDTVQGSSLFKVVGDTADSTKPISVYREYDQFLQNFDDVAASGAARREAAAAFDSTASQTIREWGVLEASQQAYQGAGDSLASQARTQDESGFGSGYVPFVEPQGSQPDGLIDSGADLGQQPSGYDEPYVDPYQDAAPVDDGYGSTEEAH
jgi:hypothetical protein